MLQDGARRQKIQLNNLGKEFAKQDVANDSFDSSKPTTIRPGKDKFQGRLQRKNKDAVTES